MHQLLQNLRFALRQLRRSPGFAVTAVLTLALGVGANSAIFSLLDQALLRSLPVREPGQLVILQSSNASWQGRSSSHGGEITSYFSYPMYRDLRDKSSAFSGLVATSTTSAGLTRHGQPSVVDAEVVSGNYFQVLGTEPAVGRLLTPADDNISGNYQVVALSYGYWKDKLGADPGVVGEVVQINGHPVQIVGVAAPQFHSAVWGQTPAIYAPMAMVGLLDPSQAKALTDHRNRWLNIVGRMRDGLTTQQAQAEVAPLWHALRADELSTMGKRSQRFVDGFLNKNTLLVLPGARGLSYRREGLQTPLMVVMGMALLVLLIAAVNVASLLLVRSSGRVREFAVRFAVGATASRIVSQLLLEGVLIGLLGACAGVLLAPVAMHAISSRLVSEGDPTYFTAGVDTRLLAISFLTAIVVSAVFSIAPALQLLRPDMVSSLKQQAGTAGSGRLGFRRVVVGLQVGLSVLLLVGAGLFVQTLRNLRKADVGFNTSNLLTFGIDPELAGIAPEQMPALHQAAIDRLASIPGVTAVGVTTSPELSGSNSANNFSIQGYTPAPDEEQTANTSTISTDFFPAMQVPMLAGRNFTPTDDLQHPHVVIVNAKLATRYFGSPANAVGHFFAQGAGDKLDWMQIVGVARDMRHNGAKEDVRQTYFVPLKQDKEATEVIFYLRTVGNPLNTAALVRNAMHDVAPSLALINLRGIDQQIDDELTNERMIGLLAISFSVLATLLAGIGLYGVLAFSVAQRTREIGIRMALGSTRALVARLVVADVLKLTGIGIAVALPCALLAARAVRTQLYGVSAADPVSVVAAVLLIATVALAAALLPARRAATVHPNTALRTE